MDILRIGWLLIGLALLAAPVAAQDRSGLQAFESDEDLLAFLVVVLVFGRIAALGPVGAHQDPGARSNATVVCFPVFYEFPR